MEFKDLTEEQKAEVRACKSPEEILELAKDEGYELSDEELESISGGADWNFDIITCPSCGTKIVLMNYSGTIECEECGNVFSC